MCLVKISLLIENWKFVLIEISLFILQDQESAGAKAFLSVAAVTDDVPFTITSSADVFKEYKVEKDNVVLFKKASNMFEKCYYKV